MSKERIHSGGAFCAFLLLLSASLIAQNPIYRVVANNGLKLRAAPNRHAKVLAVAPFASEVAVLVVNPKFSDSRPYSKWRDTIGVLRLISNGKIVEMPHVGFWLPVQFQNKEGYMFSGFLEKMAKYSWGSELNEEYRLREIGGNECQSNNAEFDKSFQWMGLFKKGKRFEVRPIHLRYAVIDNKDTSGLAPEFSGINCEMILQIDDVETPIYIIGSKTKIASRVFDGAQMNLNASQGFNDSTTTEQWIKEVELAHTAGLKSVQTTFSANNTRYFWELEGKVVGLNAILLSKNGNTLLKAETLLWMGDLDGDGKRDFIFDCGANFEGGGVTLFLSSAAQKGELIRAVAVLWWWYCC